MAEGTQNERRNSTQEDDGASSDTDSFVQVASYNSDSDWERVSLHSLDDDEFEKGSNHSSDTENDLEDVVLDGIIDAFNQYEPTQPIDIPPPNQPPPLSTTQQPSQPTPLPTQPTPLPTQPSPLPSQPTPLPTQPAPLPTHPSHLQPQPSQPSLHPDDVFFNARINTIVNNIYSTMHTINESINKNNNSNENNNNNYKINFTNNNINNNNNNNNNNNDNNNNSNDQNYHYDWTVDSQYHDEVEEEEEEEEEVWNEDLTQQSGSELSRNDVLRMATKWGEMDDTNKNEKSEFGLRRTKFGSAMFDNAPASQLGKYSSTSKQMEQEDLEEEMLKQAIALSMQDMPKEPSTVDYLGSKEWKKPVKETKPTLTHFDAEDSGKQQKVVSFAVGEQREKDVEKGYTPEDPIDRLSSGAVYADFLATHSVYTIRQLANFEALNEIAVAGQNAIYYEKLLDLQEKAVKAVSRYAHSQAKKTKKAEALKAELEQAPVWGYHYLGEAVYEQIKEDKELKSAYVLFQEYMNCPLEHRNLHPWKRVYHAYLSDAAKWNGARGKNKIDNLTDADIYSFLVWRAVESFAKLDVTAGPRAIYFSWAQMPKTLHADAVEIDQIMGEDLRNPTICDRYKYFIKINLSELCQRYKAKLFRVELKGDVLDTNHWHETSLTEALDWSKAPGLWSHFEPGNSFFSCVPHGCIVTPSGTIPWECLEIPKVEENAEEKE